MTKCIKCYCKKFNARIFVNNKVTENKSGSDKNLNIKRGDIYYADLSPVVGSEQGGLRPVLIVQNDVGNRYSPTVIAAAITSRLSKTKLPTHIDVYADKVGLAKDSVILLEQIRTIDKQRLKEKTGHLDDDIMSEVNEAITVSFGLNTPYGYAHGTQENTVPYEYRQEGVPSAAPAAVASEQAPSQAPENPPYSQAYVASANQSPSVSITDQGGAT